MGGKAILSRKQLKKVNAPPSCLLILQEVLKNTGTDPVDKLGLYYAVCKFSSNHCEDPRDKIYGILGVVNYDERNRIEADYSHSVRDVFLSTVESIITIELR
jgi:hypothetical protein